MGVIYTDKDTKFAKEHEISKTPWEVWRLILSSGPRITQKTNPGAACERFSGLGSLMCEDSL